MTVSVDEKAAITATCQAFIDTVLKLRFLPVITPTRFNYPKTIRVDNGSEFISRDLDLWTYAHDVTMDFSRPGKPTDNAYIESFNGSLRADCLNK